MKKPEIITVLNTKSEDGIEITYHLSLQGTVCTEIKYPKDYLSLDEDIQQQNENLPKTRRKYVTEEGKVVSYLTAKKLGIIS